MKTGLLWFDDDSERTLEDKVLRAAARYKQKYGHAPDLCFVHPDTFEGNDEAERASGIEIRAGRSILTHHFWIGVDEDRNTEITPGQARQLAMNHMS